MYRNDGSGGEGLGYERRYHEALEPHEPYAPYESYEPYQSFDHYGRQRGHYTHHTSRDARHYEDENERHNVYEEHDNEGVKEDDDQFGVGWLEYEEQLGRSRMNVPTHEFGRTLTTAPRTLRLRTDITSTSKAHDRGSRSGNRNKSAGGRTITNGSKKHHRSRNVIRTNPKKIKSSNSNNEIGDLNLPEMSQVSPLSRRKGSIITEDVDGDYDTDPNEVLDEQVRRDQRLISYISLYPFICAPYLLLLTPINPILT